MILKHTSWTKPALAAQNIADRQKRVAAMSIVFFLPMLSLSVPAKRTPIIEPTRAHPTYHPCCIVSRLNWPETLLMVPDITAVSYPKRIPPMAATTAIKSTYPLFLFLVNVSISFEYWASVA